MATTINSLRFTTQLNWDVKDTLTFGDHTTSGTDAPGSTESTMAHGTGANQADLVHLYKGTLAGGAALTLDLTGGGLTDAMGNAFNAARIKAVYFRQIASAGNTGTHCLVANTVANSAVAWAVPVRRGGAFCVFAPDATGIATVTAGTADQFRVTNGDGANSVEFFLAIVCASA